MQLLDELLPKLQSIAQKLTSDLCLQEDLVQEMRLHLWQQWQAHPNQTPAWYVQSCQYHARDYLKAGRSIDSKPREGVERVSLWQEDAEGGWEPLPISSENGFEDEIIFRDLLAKVRRRLTEKQGRTLDLWLQGYTEKEIGRMERVSRQSIHQQKKRIQEVALGVLADA